jgi:fibronectin-binding autotransporter adhesin
VNAHSHKVIFSQRLGTLVAVGEHACAQGKSASGEVMRAAVLAAALFLGSLNASFALDASALPTGGDVRHGAATVGSVGATMTINQTSSRATINWQSFNVGSGAKVNIVQPSSSAALLNRVVGNEMSQIHGQINANGQVVLVNPNGVLVGSSGAITASAFTATTFGISDADFESGKMRFTRNGSSAGVSNEGSIKTHGGYVALIGATVSNSGTITTNGGNAMLGAGDAVSIPLAGNIRLELDPANFARVDNSGTITTSGGQVFMRASAVVDAVSKVANATVTHSGTINTSGGRVDVLADSGTVRVSGTIVGSKPTSTAAETETATETQTPASITTTETDSTSTTEATPEPEAAAETEIAVETALIPAPEAITEPAPTPAPKAVAETTTPPTVTDTTVVVEVPKSHTTGGSIFIGRDEHTNILAAVGDASGARLESLGGFVETSGQFLKVDGARVIAKDWLLDPTDITIAASSPSGDPYSDNFTAGTTSVILASDIVGSLNAGTNVTIATSSNGTDAGNITVSSSISKTSGGAASLTLTAHNNIILNAGISSSEGTLGVTLNAGGTGGISGNASGTINTNGGMITLNTTHASASGTLAGVISGTGAVTKTGIGTTTFTGQNSYSGGTHVQTGKLVGTNAGGDNHTYRGFGSGTITIDNSAIAHANGVNGTGYNNLTNTVTGAGTFQITGSGVNRTLVNGDYSGFTGTIELLARNTQLTSGVNTTAEVNINAGATLSVWTVHGTPIFGALSGSGTVTAVVSGSANMTIGNGGAHGTFAGVISNSGTISINKVGSGTQILTGANTYTGITTISGGTLQIGNGGTSGTLGTGAVINNAMLAVNRSNNITVANVISGTGGLTQSGGGITTLTAANTFTGTTLVSGGTLALGHVNALQNSTLNTGTSGAQQITFTLGGANTYNIGALEGADDLVIGANSIGVGSNNASTIYSGVISGSGNFTKAGTGTQTLSGDNTYTGTTTISGGTLQIGAGGTTGTLGTGAVTDNSSLIVNRSNEYTIANAISGTGSISQIGTGTTTLTADNTYSGTTTISGGTLQVGNGGSTGTLGVGDVTLSNNASLHYLRSATTNIFNTISGTGNLSATITGTSSDLSVNGAVNLTGGTVNLSTDAYLTLSQSLTTSNTTESAIVLIAGKPTSAGTSTGGDISFTGSGAVNVGTGGRATLYTGSLLGSTGLGIATGNNRYNSDEQTSNYTAALGSGTYAIYREAPTLNVRFNDTSKTYDAQAFTGGNGLSVVSGFVNGDTSTTFSSISYSGTAQNATNAGTYAISGTALSSQGYVLNISDGSLEIDRRDISITGLTAASKAFDGNTSASITGGSFDNLVAGETLGLSGTGAFNDAAAGNNKTVTVPDVAALNQNNGSGLWQNYRLLSTGPMTALANISAAPSNSNSNSSNQPRPGVGVSVNAPELPAPRSRAPRLSIPPVEPTQLRPSFTWVTRSPSPLTKTVIAVAPNNPFKLSSDEPDTADNDFALLLACDHTGPEDGLKLCYER